MILFEVHFKDYPQPRPYARHGIDLRRKFTYLKGMDLAPTGLWIDVDIPEVNRGTGERMMGKAKLAVPWEDIEYILAFDDGIPEPHPHHRPIGFIHAEEEPESPPPQNQGPVTPVD